jgi:hypothetical protein
MPYTFKTIKASSKLGLQLLAALTGRRNVLITLIIYYITEFNAVSSKQSVKRGMFSI